MISLTEKQAQYVRGLLYTKLHQLENQDLESKDNLEERRLLNAILRRV